MEVWVGSCSLRHPTQTSLVFSFLCLTMLRATLSDYYRSSFYQPNTWTSYLTLCNSIVPRETTNSFSNVELDPRSITGKHPIRTRVYQYIIIPLER